MNLSKRLANIDFKTKTKHARQIISNTICFWRFPSITLFKNLNMFNLSYFYYKIEFRREFHLGKNFDGRSNTWILRFSFLLSTLCKYYIV